MITNRSFLKRFSLFFVSLILIGVLATFVMATVSQTPLFLTNTARPNVMILLDNSGSMDNIMMHKDFDPTKEYSGDFNDDEDYYQYTSAGYHYLWSIYGSRDYIFDDKNGNFTHNGKTVKLPLPYNNTRWSGRYLNWIFFHGTTAQLSTLSTDTSLTKTRIMTSRAVVSNLVKNISSVDFGIAVFNDNQGGKIKQKCGELTAANVDDTVNGISASTWTPLGESLAEIWQYFKGATSSYNPDTSYTSPFTVSCQKNFTIIVTDGEPTYDGCYKDDFSAFGCADGENTTSHLADVASHMHSHDAVSTMSGSHVDTYTIGLTISSDLLEQTATSGGGRYYTTLSGIDLDTALNSAMTDILNRVSSASSVAVNTAFLTSNTKLYRTRFNSGEWSGFLEAYRLNQADGSIIGYPNSPLWEAGNLLESNTSRHIYSAGVTSSIYQRLNFSTDNYSTLVSVGLALPSDNNAQNLISYIRGDSTPAGYRQRTGKLGDMTYSAPVIMGPPDGYYTDNNYQAFKSSHSNRASRIVVGANDGMLHSFDAENGQERWAYIPNSLLSNLKLLSITPYVHQNYVDGTPTIADAFIKSKNSSGVSDANPAWHTILVCGLREGGNSYFALDVTDPDNPIPLWEINPSSPSANGLGYTFGNPLILKLKDRSQTSGFVWVAVLPNGYQGTTASKSASLLIVNLSSGEILKEIVVDSTSNVAGGYQNGLSSPSAVDTEGDGFANFIYAGDLKGRLWKFDVSSDTVSNWDVSYHGKTGSLKPPVPIFYATDSEGAPQPITVAPDIVLRGGFQVVFFGTGKYYEDSDKATTQTQTFYGLFDYNLSDSDPPVNGKYSKSNLIRQIITQTTDSTGSVYRWITDNTVTPNSNNGTQLGWYVDLPSSGERVISDPVAHAGKIIFTTFTPNSDACSFGGTSWLMELKQDTGGSVSVFDVNNDSMVDDNDKINGHFPVGYALGDGAASSPTIVGGNGDNEYKYITKTTGEIMKILEGGGTSQIGLRSWRQLR